MEQIIVVGAGLGGVRTVEALREAGYTGALMLVGAERYLPYDRPPLSKRVLRGQRLPADIRLRDDAFLADQGVGLPLRGEVSAVDSVRRELTLAGGSVIGCDQLVIATGLVARSLRGPDRGRGLHWLRGGREHARAGRRRRVEHWTRTSEQARTVASAILGRHDPGADSRHVWSDQYGTKIQLVGDLDGWDDVSVQEDDGQRLLATYCRNGLLTAVAGAGRAKRVARLRTHRHQPIRTIEEVRA